MTLLCPRCTRCTAVLDLCPECRAWDQQRLTGPVVVLGVEVEMGPAPRQCGRAQAGMAMRRTLAQRNGPQGAPESGGTP